MPFPIDGLVDAVQTGVYDVQADSICEPERLNVIADTDVADTVVAVSEPPTTVLPVIV